MPTRINANFVDDLVDMEQILVFAAERVLGAKAQLEVRPLLAHKGQYVLRHGNDLRNILAVWKTGAA